MKVLEVTTTTRIRDPHRPPNTALTQHDTFRASDGYGLELHPSGLACLIRGRDHTRLAPIASAIVLEDDAERVTEVPAPLAAAKRGGRR